MVMAAGHGAMTMMIGKGHVLSTQYCADRASSIGSGTAVRTMTTVRIGRAAGFGCSSAEAAAVSSSPCCRIQRGMVITSTGRRSSRRMALSSRQSDVAVGGEADAMADEEPMASFWVRLQQAWRVLIGGPSEVQATRKRFSRLLVRDRGFSSANLSRLYNVAKLAIKEHVELEGDEDAEVTAVVDRLGELRLDFRVKRVKSVLMDEPFSVAVLPDIDPSLSINGDELWGSSRVIAQDLDVRGGRAVHVEPSQSISGDRLWEYGGAPLDLKSRLGNALDRPFRNSVFPQGEASLSISGEELWEDKRAPEDLGADVEVVAELTLTSGGRTSDGDLPNSVPDVEPHSSSSGGQLWEDNSTSQDLEVQANRVSNLMSTKVEGTLNEPPANFVVPEVELDSSISGDQLWDDSKAERDIQVLEGASEFTSTITVDSEGVWYTFTFRDDELEQGTEVDKEKEL